MQPQRRPDPSGPFLCQADACDEAATHSWVRLDEAGNQVLVYACDPHALDDETAALVHQTSCVAPPTCTCDPVLPEEQPEPTP